MNSKTKKCILSTLGCAVLGALLVAISAATKSEALGAAFIGVCTGWAISIFMIIRGKQ